MVTLVTKPKEGRKQREQKFDQKVAERVLQKSNHKEFGWTLPDDSDFKFEGGSLIQKAKKKSSTKKSSETVEDQGDKADK